MKPIRLIEIYTKECDNDFDFDTFQTKYELIYEYDDNDNEKVVGLKIIDSCQYSQEDADRDWQQVLGYIKEDEKRMDDYGRTWYVFGIRAIAVLHFPEERTEDMIIQRISSPGLLGIESDSEEEYFKDEEMCQIAILLDMLAQMNVNVPDTFVCNLGVSDGKISVKEIRDRYK